MILEIKKEVDFLRRQIIRGNLISVSITFDTRQTPYVLEFKYSLMDKDLRNILEIEGFQKEVLEELENYLNKLVIPVLKKKYKGYYKYTDDFTEIKFQKNQ